MKKIEVTLILFSLLAVSLQVGEKAAQQNVLADQMVRKLLDSVDMNSTTLGIVQAFLETNGVNKDEAQSLYQGFDLLLAALQRMKKNEDEEYRNISKILVEVRQTTENNIQQLTKQFNQNNAELDGLRPERESVNDQINRGSRDLSSTETKISLAKQLKNQTLKEKRKALKHYEELIKRIDIALDIVAQIGQGDNSKKTALLQIHDEVSAHLDQSEIISWRPLITALFQIASQGDTDKLEIVGKLQELLNYMRKQLTDEESKLKEKFDGQLGFIDQQLKNYEEFKAKTISKIDQDKKELERYDERIKTLEKFEGDYKAQMAQYQKTLDGIDADQKRAKELHIKEKKEYNDEIALVKKGMEYLEENGIFRY